MIVDSRPSLALTLNDYTVSALIIDHTLIVINCILMVPCYITLQHCLLANVFKRVIDHEHLPDR